jgi:hypothetical protein
MLREFTLVSLTTGFTSILYLIIAKILESYTSPIIANGIGLIVDITLDFLFQSWIFLDNINIKKYSLIVKFIISKLITTTTSQILFIIYIKYFKIKNFDNTFIRIIISILVFLFLVFPLSKYFVFSV